MVDKIYENAFAEVYEILKNTDEELLNKIPNKFIEFVKANKSNDYKSNIKNDIEIDKQNLLPETESIISLIYRSYWATEKEKIEFAQKDREEMINEEKKKEEEYKGKSIEEIFKAKKDLNKIKLNQEMIVIEKKNFITKILDKLKTLFRGKR